VLNPLIYGRSDQLPALTVFLAFLAGSLLWGILGALIAIPAGNIIRILVREFVASRAPRTAPPASAPPQGGAAPHAASDADAGRDTC
jgi:predicted PurR-regulated permease PerM